MELERWKCEPDQGIIFLHRNLGNFIMSGLSSIKLDLFEAFKNLLWLLLHLILSLESILLRKFKTSSVWCLQVWKDFNLTLPFMSLRHVHNDQKTILGWPLSKGRSVLWQMKTDAHLLFLISKHIRFISKHFSVLENLLPLNESKWDGFEIHRHRSQLSLRVHFKVSPHW